MDKYDDIGLQILYTSCS